MVFAIIALGGKLILPRSLFALFAEVSTRMSSASPSLKLADLEIEERRKIETGQRLVEGKAAIKDLVKEYAASSARARFRDTRTQLNRRPPT